MEQNQDIFQKAIYFANKKHDGQFRKHGIPYITHPLRVADIVKKFKKSKRINEIMAAAVLHDILEDTDTTIFELRENFGELITLLIIELTSDQSKIKEIGKTEYLSRKLSSSKKISRWTLLIKLADRLDNVSDLKYLDKEFAVRKKQETEDILKYLEENRELSKTHKKLIFAIRKKLGELDV